MNTIEGSPAVFGTPSSGPDCRRLHRLYNNRPDANHRYTVSEQIRDEMVAKGCIREGRHGYTVDLRYAMCLPK